MVVSAGGLTDVRVDLSHFEPEFQVLHEGLLRELVQQNKVRLPILGRAEGGHASLLRLKVPGGEVEGAAHAQVKAPSRTPPAASSVELPEARSDCLSSLARRNTSEFRPTPCSRTRFDSRNLHCACAITLPQLRMPVSACVKRFVCMSGASREVLRLYRAILRRGNRLEYTDKDFFRSAVRLEFKKCSRDTQPEVVLRNIEVNASIASLSPFYYFLIIQQKAKYFLQSNLGGLI